MARKVDTDKRRKCYGQLPVPSERADLFWSLKQLVGVTDAVLTSLLLATPEFQATVGLELQAIDNRNRTGFGNKMGRPSKWSSLQLESVLIYRRVAGLEDIKRTCERLVCDEEARLLLELGEKPPSRATLTRYIRQHFNEAKRVEQYLELDRRLRARVCQLPGFDREARILGMDGSQHGTHFTAPIPIINKKKKRVGWTNKDIEKGKPGAITAETAGYVGRNNPKSGRGWQLLGLWTEHGTLVAWDISPLNESEKTAAHRVLASYEEEVLQHRSDALTVCTADGGFNSDKLRAQLQSFGIVPNIHKASHKLVPGLEDEQTENASRGIRIGGASSIRASRTTRTGKPTATARYVALALTTERRRSSPSGRRGNAASPPRVSARSAGTSQLPWVNGDLARARSGFVVIATTRPT